MKKALYFCLFLQIAVLHCRAGAYSWDEKPDSLALLKNGHVLWRSNHRIGEEKPCIHPLGPGDGTVLTAFRPADHPWHRGLWFAWKYINGVNYWEEKHDQKSAGRTEVLSVKVDKGFWRHEAVIEMELSYHLPGAPPLLLERRTIRFLPPEDNGYTIEWESCFQVIADDVLLDRTHIPGEVHGRKNGGYAGFSLRAARETIGWKLQASSGLKDAEIHGQPARWVSFSGQTVNGRDAAIAIMDHPGNIRHPSLWFIVEKMPYFSPAVIFASPALVHKGDEIDLRYKVIVRDGSLSDTELAGIWEKWRGK